VAQQLFQTLLLNPRTWFLLIAVGMGVIFSRSLHDCSFSHTTLHSYRKRMIFGSSARLTTRDSHWHDPAAAKTTCTWLQTACGCPASMMPIRSYSAQVVPGQSIYRCSRYLCACHELIG